MTEAFLCDGIRTPIGRYAGALSSVRADDLAAIPLRALVARNREADWAALDDVVLGSANQAGEDNRNVARMALLLAGLPESVGGTTVNRLCGSGLDAIAIAARAIKSGEGDFFLAGGVESMSRAPFVMPKGTSAFSRDTAIHDTTIGWRFINPEMDRHYGTDSMGETAENVAEAFGIGRAEQDEFAARSQQRAAVAIATGRLAPEITPVAIPGRKGAVTLVDTDEHPRADTDAAALARLKPIFRPGGSVTAGNSSGINDGAAAVIVASEAAIRRHGLTPRARVLGAATAGVAPRLMGIGPVPATRKLLSRLGLTIAEIDLIELNEAFAAQALAVLRELGLAGDADHVNPNGGAIALGHPLGMSGARLALTASLGLAGGDRGLALCTMCIGVGQGIAMVLQKI